MAALTLQAAEDALKASQAAFETAAANLDKARTLARSDGPRPFGGYPSVADATTAYAAAISQRDADQAALIEAQSQDQRKPGWQSDYAKATNALGR
jgi:hypothetical protein